MSGLTYGAAKNRSNTKVSVLASALLAAGLCITASYSPNASAIDFNPGDWVAAPAGTNLFLGYYQLTQFKDFYVDGSKIPGNNELDANIGIVRPVHYFKLGNYTALSQAILPFGKLEGKGDMSGLGDATGISDLILSNAIWLITGDSQHTNWGFAHYIWVPTGSYDKNDALNLGENRWKWTLATGLAQGLTDKLSLDFAADVTLFGSNNEFGAASNTLSQDPYYTAQTSLRYDVTPSTNVFVGYAYEWGGEQSVDNVTVDGSEQKKSRFYVGGSSWVMPSVQIQAYYGQDISVESGFEEEHRFHLRLLKAF